jgi:hypothetical protein
MLLHWWQGLLILLPLHLHPHICKAYMIIKAVSVPIGYSDDNIVAISRNAKVPKTGPKIVYKRSYKILYYYRTLIWMVLKIFVCLVWLIRSVQTLHLMNLWNCFFQLWICMHMFRKRNWKTVWIRDGQNLWLIRLHIWLADLLQIEYYEAKINDVKNAEFLGEYLNLSEHGTR